LFIIYVDLIIILFFFFFSCFIFFFVGSPEALKFADILLYCTSNASFEIANIVLPFWYCLFKAVWPSKNSGSDGDKTNGGSPQPLVV